MRRNGWFVGVTVNLTGRSLLACALLPSNTYKEVNTWGVLTDRLRLPQNVPAGANRRAQGTADSDKTFHKQRGCKALHLSKSTERESNYKNKRCSCCRPSPTQAQRNMEAVYVAKSCVCMKYEVALSGSKQTPPPTP